MSNQTSSDFAECIEWAAEQSWCTGKVGLLGISYFGGSQWRVAARRPKGLACIIPWEGECPLNLRWRKSCPLITHCLVASYRND